MPSNGTPKRPRPTYCDECECDRPHLPEIGCVVCAARAAKPGGLRLRPGVEPAYELEPDMEERRREVRQADIEKRRASNGHYYSLAPLIVNAIRRDRRRRIYPQH